MKNQEFDIFDLDKFRLDEEWVEQPKLYFESASKLAASRQEYERAKAERDVVKAEEELKVRNNPEKYGLEKTTEAAIGQVVTTSLKLRVANEKIITTKYEMDMQQAEVDALEHRKKALENLVQLEARNYFSAPKASKETVDRMRNVEEKSHFNRKGKK